MLEVYMLAFTCVNVGKNSDIMLTAKQRNLTLYLKIQTRKQPQANTPTNTGKSKDRLREYLKTGGWFNE